MRTALALTAFAGALWLGASALGGALAAPTLRCSPWCGEDRLRGRPDGRSELRLHGRSTVPICAAWPDSSAASSSAHFLLSEPDPWTERATWGKSNCKETITDDPAALRACKLAAKSQGAADKATVKSELHDAAAACNDWSTICQSTCQGS